MIVLNCYSTAFIADKPRLDSFANKRGASQPELQDRKLETLFREHATRWKKETQYLSSATKMFMHPSYRRIMGMGPDALPLILSELKQHPDHWFVALNAISGEDPAPVNSTFDQAVAAWVAWGIKNGYLR